MRAAIPTDRNGGLDVNSHGLSGRQSARAARSACRINST